MKRLSVLLAGLCVLAAAVPAQALVMAPAPIPNRVALADCIVVGKITAIEAKTIQAKRFPTVQRKSGYKVAVIAVAQGLKGAKGLTRIRLGFVPPPPPPNNNNPNVPRLPRRRFPQLNHKVGQEGLFFLTRHFDQDFFVATMYFDVIDKKNTNFAKNIAEVKSYSKLLENPMAGLKSKNAQERLNTAAMLMTRYRSVKPGAGKPKQVPIPAAESQLILNAILTADWAARPNFSQVSAMQLFNQLGLAEKDGWNRRRRFKNYAKEFPPVAQQWLRKHKDSYRIKKYVSQ